MGVSEVPLELAAPAARARRDKLSGAGEGYRLRGQPSDVCNRSHSICGIPKSGRERYRSSSALRARIAVSPSPSTACRGALSMTAGRPAHNREKEMTEQALPAEDFSVILGGPLYQLVRRARLSGDSLELLRRRIAVISLFAWLPLLVLSMLDRRTWGDAVSVPFLKDIEVHVRFLLALPLLIVAEPVVHQRLRTVVRQFLERGLIAPASRARFDALLPSAIRLRNSIVAEVCNTLVPRAFTLASIVALTCRPCRPGDGRRQLTTAGRVPVCEPPAVPVHAAALHPALHGISSSGRSPDASSGSCRRIRIAQAGSASSQTPIAFAPLQVAQGAGLRMIANLTFYKGAKPPDFKMELVVPSASCSDSWAARCSRPNPRGPGAAACASAARRPSVRSSTEIRGGAPRMNRSWGRDIRKSQIWARASKHPRHENRPLH